jgi:hypothetical protein
MMIWVGSNIAKFSRCEGVHCVFVDAGVACSHGLRVLRGVGTLIVDLQTLSLLVFQQRRILKVLMSGQYIWIGENRISLSSEAEGFCAVSRR